jgi:hypothetical protein
MANGAPSGVSGGSAGGLPLPPGFPPGVDPETFRIGEVTALLRAAAYFPLGTSSGGVEADGLAAGATRVRVAGRLVRRELGGEPGRGGEPPSFRDCADGTAARLGATVRPMPDSFVAAPDRLPPPTPLAFDRPQRLGFYDLELAFGVGDHGFRGFGTGRTFPRSNESAGGPVPFAAVVEPSSAWGRFADLPAAIVMEGSLEPPNRVRLRAMVRVMDPDGRVTTRHRVPPGRPRSGSGGLTLALLGEPDPERPVRLILGPGGLPVGSRVFERLRLVDLDFSVGEVRPRARRAEGPVVGDVEAILVFDPLTRAPVVPIQTRRGVFRLLDGDGAVAGTLTADMVEGRGFPTRLDGAPAPVFRFGGFGPLLRGTGCFAGAAGMMTMDSAISVFPRTLSNLYLLQLDDPDESLRAPCDRSGRFGLLG